MVADSHLHRLFDNGQWLLMPEDCIIKKYFESMISIGGQLFVQRECFPNFPVCLLQVIQVMT
jgi:hypothetical protein